MEIEIVKLNISKSIVKVLIGNGYNESKKEMTKYVELDIENQTRFISEINEVLASGRKKVIVDITYVNYIDSSGLWALFEGYKKTTQKKGKFVLISPSKDVKRVLDITKMSEKLEIVENEKDALAAVG